MIRANLPELEVSSEKTFDFSNEETYGIIEELDNNIAESARKSRIQEIESIQEAKELGKFSSFEFQSQKKKRNKFLTMEEKKQMVLSGEQVPICTGKSTFNEGSVKYYSRTLKKKMKL